MRLGILSLASILSVAMAPLVFSVDAPKPTEVEAAIQIGCEILIGNQENYTPDPAVGGLPEEELSNWQAKEKERLAEIRKAANGEGAEWPYEGVYRVSPDNRIPPGYRVGGSAIVCEALLEAPGLNDTRRSAITRSVEFMLDRIHNDSQMAPNKQTSYDVRGWGQAYALKFFLRAIETGFFKDAELKKRVEETIPHLIACLKEGQISGGGWNYAGRGVSPFMTASTLLALFHAKEAGYTVDTRMVEDALDALEAGRDDKVSYAYSGKLRNPDEPMQGACARSAAAELVLFKAGRSSVENLRIAVDGFFTEENWKELLKRKSQQGTHKRPYSVAPYYFFYGHTYAALAVEHLPEKERAEYREKMRDLLWRTIERGGAWNDRIFPRTESYSTAMSILSLIADDLPAVKTWRSSTAL